MSLRASDNTPVTFQEVAACFSEEEWKLLHHWQKELYKNVMYEIHQAVSLLGPLISTAVFSLRAKENTCLRPEDHHDAEGRQVERHLDSDPLLTLQTEEPQYREVPENLEAREIDDPPSTADNPIITSVFSLYPGHEGELHFHELELERRNPAPDPVFTSVFSLLHYWEEKPLKEDPEPEEIYTGNGSINRNGIDGDSIRCINVTTQFKAQSEKTIAKVIQGCEQTTNCGSQQWLQPSQELGRGFINLAHSNLHQGTDNVERADEHIMLENNFRNAELPMYLSNVQQYTPTESGEPYRQKKGLITHQKPHNSKREKCYQCIQCEKSFHLKSSLLAHNKTHRMKKPFQCTYCDKCFSMKPHLVNHQRIHTNEPNSEKLPLRETPHTEFKENISWKEHHLVRRRRHEKTNSVECEQSVFQDGIPVTSINIPNWEKPHKCTECEKSFDRKGSLLLHCRTHVGDKHYHCTTCEKSFRIKSLLVSHQRSHTGEKPYKCTECEKCFSQKGNLMVHVRRHHEIRKSPVYEEGSFLEGSRLADVRTHNGEKPFKCSHCEKVFKLKAHLASHLRSHAREKTYHCTDCEKSFKRKGFLMLHIRSHDGKRKNPESKIDFSQKGSQIAGIETHNGKERYQCTKCEKSFRLKRHLANHQNRHEEEKPYQCTKCEKRFNLKGSLWVHNRRHHFHNEDTIADTRANNGEKPYQCTRCEESFRLKAQLFTHQRRHENQKPYQCTDCEKTFNLKGSLRVHISRHHDKRKNPEGKIGFFQKDSSIAGMRTYSGEKPYRCTLCEKSFRLKAHLVTHQRRHKKEKCYQCTECEKQFFLKASLRVHFIRHHENRKIPECKVSLFNEDSPMTHIAHNRETPHQCTQCPKSFRLEAQLVTHQRKHAGEKAHQCADCAKLFARKGNLILHISRHHKNKINPECKPKVFQKDTALADMRTYNDNDKPYHCTQCEKGFRLKSHLVSHKKIHEREKPHQCTECEKQFNLKASLRVHIRRHHDHSKSPEGKVSLFQMSSQMTHINMNTSEKPFQCTQCGQNFKLKAHLGSHTKRHTRENPDQCTEHGKSFSQMENRMVTFRKPHEMRKRPEKGSPMRHIRAHKGVKPHPCAQCEKSFIRKGALIIHNRTHRYQKLYRCTACEKSFSIKAQFVIHQQSHTVEKFFRCTGCEKCFSTKTQLVTHERIHTGEKPYPCTGCEKRFTQKGNLSIHMKRIHNKNRNNTESEKKGYCREVVQ